MSIISIAGPGSRLYTAGGGGGGNRLAGDEIFEMLYGASDGPNYGTQGYSNAGVPPPTISITRQATGGPANRPYLNYQITDTELFEFGANWTLESPFGNPSSPVVTWGQSLFIRFSYRLQSHLDQTQKIFILNPGDAQASGDRSIINMVGNPTEYIITAGLGGGASVQTGDQTALNVWHDVQFEVRFASDSSSSDGYMKLWFNNDTYASPTSSATGIPTRWRLGSVGSEWLDLFGYHQADVANTLPRNMDISDVRVGPTFDSNWHSSGA